MVVKIANTKFDVVVIDEAAQALEAVCWVPIMKTVGVQGAKLVLVRYFSSRHLCMESHETFPGRRLQTVTSDNKV